MSKNKKLKKDDVEGYEINQAVLQTIESYCRDTKIAREDIRILDYGSGRGRSVAVLRNMGFSAFGVEIDPIPFNNGFDYFVQEGYEPGDFLFLMENDCKTVFEDDFFDMVFSEQVLEHVEDIEVVIREISRITKHGGVHIHTFPAKYHLVEQHLFMPVIHWLPKNRIRKWAVFIFTKLGKEPFWESLNGKSVNEKTRVYFNYSVKKTYYRSAKKIEKIFKKHGFLSRHKYFYNTRKGVKGRIDRLFSSQVQISSQKTIAPIIKQ